MDSDAIARHISTAYCGAALVLALLVYALMQ